MKKKTDKNYLDGRPMRNENINWTVDENKIVILEIENKGIFNKIAQKLLKKPRISYVHLDEMGSFIWPMLDGKMTVLELGKFVEEEFGEKALPLYERLSKYISILDSYRFIKLD